MVEVLAAMVCRLASPSGPIFLYQDKSTRWLAIFCPELSRVRELGRWVRGLKYPNVREKFEYGFCLGWVRVWVVAVSSRARMMPAVVTRMAAAFVSGGIVIGGVCVGVMYDVISRPTIMLPRARRVIGLVICRLFSSIGVIVGIRVNFVCTRRAIRRLYVAVKAVASNVRVSAQAFRWEVFRFSMIRSFEKNPARKGVPISARLPIVRQEVVVGSIFCKPPIFRMSCSPPRLWMIDPEHRNSMALKKAWVEMCKKASCGRFSPMVTIISPSWLDVEKAMIFLMSFCVRAQVAANSVDIAPKHRHSVRAVLLLVSRG